MSDQPALKHLRLRLDVKLQPEHVRANRECLRWTNFCRGEPFGIHRQIEIIAMPVQHIDAIEWRQDRAFACLCQINGSITDFLGRSST